MHPVQKHLFDTNFKDLAGSRIEGTLALSDELINLGILDFIQGIQGDDSTTAAAAPARAPRTQSGSAPATSVPDPKAMLALLDIKTLKIRAEQGRILLDVDVSMK